MSSMYQSVVEAEEDEEGEDLEEDGEGGDVGENLQSKRFQFKKVHKQRRLAIHVITNNRELGNEFMKESKGP